MESNEEDRYLSRSQEIAILRYSTNGPRPIVPVLVVSMLIFSLPYFFPPPSHQIVNGLITFHIYEPEVVSSNEVWLTFFDSRGHSPSYFWVLLRNSTHEGIYSIPSGANNTFLALESGDNMGILTYIDFQDDESINSFDKIRITGLDAGSDYFFGITWGLSGHCVGYVTFATPNTG